MDIQIFSDMDQVLKINIRSPLVATSVEHDSVSGTRSNRFLQFRTGPGSDCISKN